MIAPNDKNGRPTETAGTPDVAGRASAPRTHSEDNDGHDTDNCPCSNDVFAEGPCRDCRSVFAAKREQLLASLRASEAQGWPEVPASVLGVDDTDGDALWHLGDDYEPRDTVEDVT